MSSELCAAPGGKTLQMAAAGAEVTSLDLSAPRLERLRDNLARTGLKARVVQGDALEFGEGGWDAILLDVDNGPDGLTHAGNDKLYSARGLQVTKRALHAGGVLAIWSAYADPAFTKRLRDSGYAVEEQVVRARGTKGARHVIWLAGRR